MKIKLAVLFGGKSVEHEVSIITALQAISSLDRKKYHIIPIYIDKNNQMYTGELTGFIESYSDIPALIRRSTRVVLVRESDKVLLVRFPSRFGKSFVSEIDIFMPLGHGTNVEDGVLQGFLEFLGAPYTGCDVLSSACGMNKYTQKMLLKYEGIPVLDCVKVTASEFFADAEKSMKLIEDKIGFPAVIKPINLGSSVGIKIADNLNNLEEALDHAFLFSGEVIIERAILNLREINVSVLGDKDKIEVSECEEPIRNDEILSYDDKYKSGSKGTSKSSGMVSLSRNIPADIPEELREEIFKIAEKAFRILGCSGVARVDFLYDNEANKLFYNEINTLPGSLSFYLWEPAGVNYSALLERIIEIALKRELDKKSVNFAFETNILSNVRFGGNKGNKI